MRTGKEPPSKKSSGRLPPSLSCRLQSGRLLCSQYLALLSSLRSPEKMILGDGFRSSYLIPFFMFPVKKITHGVFMKPLISFSGANLNTAGQVVNGSSDSVGHQEFSDRSVINIHAHRRGDTFEFSAQVVHVAFEDWCKLIDEH